jgi:hypothetical protein
MKILSFLSLFLLTSCALFKPTKHEQMLPKVRAHQYGQSPKELAPVVKQVLSDQKKLTAAPMIILRTTPDAPKVARAQDLASEKMKDTFFTGDIHLVKNTKEEAILVRGANIIKLTRAENGSSQISACSLTHAVRGPLRLGLDFTNFVTSGFNPLAMLKLSQDPIVLEKSLQYCRPDPVVELQLLHGLDRGLFEQWQSEAV